MSIIILTSEDIAALKSLAFYANEHLVDLSTLKAMCDGTVKPVGDSFEHVRELSSGLRAVFSLEEQPAGVMQHLSVSHKVRSRVVQPPVVELIMNELGMGNDLHDCFNVWVEEGWPAINILRMRA